MIKLTSNKLLKINTEVKKIVSTIPTAHNRKIERETFAETRKMLNNCKKEETPLQIGKSYTLLISKSYNAGSSKFTDTINYFTTTRIKYLGETEHFIRTDLKRISKYNLIGIVK